MKDLKDAKYIVVYICTELGHVWVETETMTLKEILACDSESEITEEMINDFNIKIGEELIIDDEFQVDTKEKNGYHPMEIIRIK